MQSNKFERMVMDKIKQLHQLIADADYVLIGAGAGLSAAADHPRPLQSRLSATDDRRRKQLHGIH